MYKRQLYDRSGRPVQQLVTEEGLEEEGMRDVVLTPDKKWGLTVGDSAAVQLWRVNQQTGVWTLVESLRGHGGDVEGVEFDPVDNGFVTIAPGDRVIVWSLPSDGGTAAVEPPARTGSALLRDACELAGRDLTRAEWRRYVPGRLWRPTCTDVD